MKPLLILLLILASQKDYAQNLGLGTTTPNANAILDIKSPNKGILIPRMDSVVRKQIANTKGLLVYDTTTSSLWHNDGAKWVNYMNIAKGDVTQDMLYWDGSNWVIMPKGLPGQLLVANTSGLPEWQYPATLSINNVTITEGNAGTVNMTFTVTKTALYDRAISVQYATANGTATAGPDYNSVTGTLNFLPAEMSKTITVVANTDVYGEPVETFSVNLFTAVSATITDATGTGTITDDDVYPAININPSSPVFEGNSSFQLMNFGVNMMAASNQPVTVFYQLVSGTATLGSDFSSGSSGFVTLSPGQTSAIIMVYIQGDLLYEGDETFTVNLTGADGGYITPGLGQSGGLIYNDDPIPSIVVFDAFGNEGYNDHPMTFTVRVSNPSSFTTTVNYNVSNGTAIMWQQGGNDFHYTSGTLIFPPGFTGNVIIQVTISGDFIAEPNETFFVNLTNPVNAVIADGIATGTIYNDD